VALRDTHDADALAPGDEVVLRIRAGGAFFMPRAAGARQPSSFGTRSTCPG
jgi:hypothetical protein